MVFLGGSATKNLLLWPIEVVVMAAVFRLLLPILEKQKLIVTPKK